MTLGRNVSSFLFFGLVGCCVAFDLFTRLHIFPLLIFVSASVATLEAVKLTGASGAKPWRLGVWALVMTFVVDGWLGGLAHFGLITMVAVIGLFAHALTRPVAGAAANLGAALLATLWVGLGFGSILALWSWNGPEGVTRDGRFLVVFLLAAAWPQDIFALWVGTVIGRRRLAPVISPKKSVEGSIAGFLASCGFGLAVWGLFTVVPGFRGLIEMRWWDALVLGALFGSLGQIGDLSESLLKREAGVKDSGFTATGHGGMLDIVDSLLFCAPAMMLWALARGLWMFA
jgi:phosphatidate cytidylyltransferase